MPAAAWTLTLRAAGLAGRRRQRAAAAHRVDGRRHPELAGERRLADGAEILRADRRRLVGAAAGRVRRRLLRQLRRRPVGDAAGRPHARRALAADERRVGVRLRPAPRAIDRRRAHVVGAVFTAPRRHEDPARLRVALRHRRRARPDLARRPRDEAGRRPGRRGHRRHGPAGRAFRSRLEAAVGGRRRSPRLRVLPHRRRGHHRRPHRRVPQPLGRRSARHLRVAIHRRRVDGAGAGARRRLEDRRLPGQRPGDQRERAATSRSPGSPRRRTRGTPSSRSRRTRGARSARRCGWTMRDRSGAWTSSSWRTAPPSSAGSSWRDGNAAFKVRRVERNGQRSAAITVTDLGASRNSGYPRLARRGQELIFAWTGSGDRLRVETAIARLP